jgi:TldD protein
VVFIDKDLAEFAVNLATKNGASYAEARLVRTGEEGYILKNGIPESVVFSEGEGMGIRVLVKGGMSFFALNKLTKEEIKTAVMQAIKMAKVSGKTLKEPIILAEEKKVKASWEVKPKINLADISPKEKMGYLFEIEKSLKSIKNKLVSRVFQLETSEEEKYYVNSEGTRIDSKIPRVMMYYSLVGIEGNDSEMRYFPIGESGGWEVIERWNLIEKINEESKVLLKIIKEGKRVPKEVQDVVLSPELVGIAMHESVGHPGEADRPLGREAAQAGETYATKEWIGRRIGSNFVNVVDDPSVKNSYGFYEYDDEGVKAQRRVLIQNGILNGYLHNRETAKVFGIRSNASARASAFDREPLIRMSTTFFLPGEHTFEELIEGIKKGIFIKSYTEWNIDDKRWNEKYVGSEAYRIENGELKELVRRPVLELTTQKFFSSVDGVGDKVEFISGSCGKGDPMQAIPVWMGGPHIRLRKINIGSA